MAPREDSIRNCAYYVAGLTIVDCQNFSVAALKQLVSAKLHAADGRELRTLRLYGHAPVMSIEDDFDIDACSPIGTGIICIRGAAAGYSIGDQFTTGGAALQYCPIYISTILMLWAS
jgi:hypothetical protein